MARAETPASVAPPPTPAEPTSPPRRPNPSIPTLEKRGDRTVLLVDGQPFYLLGGELGNSSASDEAYMESVWPKLAEMHVNTLLAPVYWELIEPSEGEFDFSSLEWLVRRARREQVRLVLLWFGSWKNSMSCYAPPWVKRDTERFPRVQDQNGVRQEILTPFGKASLEADAKAFRALMAFLRDYDASHRTVIMVQVENEIGMLPDARDYHPAATAAFKGPVPKELMSYLTAHEQSLVPEFRDAWRRAGGKTQGTWEQVFGTGLGTDEIFIAWHLARYANDVAQAGKAEYPLPLFVNAALNRPKVPPGKYPSGGPLPHLFDVWKAATPALDLMAPDFYNPRFKHWNDLYTRQSNPLLIPEIRFDETVGAKALFAFGHYDCLGFSPFSVESAELSASESLGKSYELLAQVLPQLEVSTQVEGVWLTHMEPEVRFGMGAYQFTARHDLTLGWSPIAKEPTWPHAGAIVARTAEHEFLVAGTGVVFTFSAGKDEATRVGIESAEEGVLVDGKWQPSRRLNGDQTHQGRHIRIPDGQWGIQRFRLYEY